MTPVEALQATLAAEHAAVHLYGVLGGQVSSSEAPERHELVVRRHATHRWRRDELAVALRRRGAEPTPAAVGYELPADLADAAAVARTALELEQGCTGTYAALVAATEGKLRGWAVAALTENATAELAWGGRPGAFPGAPEL